MSLTNGTKLGPYEIVAPLGAGGMGEVYRGRDTRLDRDVAIKVLPESLARDRERILRFEREAKVLASVNHPNIAGIYGLEESETERFLVLELVEGQTLQERLMAGPLPVDEALQVARQTAEALEAAHEQGVIHRDLKPGNVMLRPDGTVKVLDFGLAKALAEDPSKSTLANSPTITANYTRPGIVLGTAAYMSPEQARGRQLDKRTDIWSFGVVLYECLCGRRPFEGDTVSDMVARILERDPDWTALPPATPPLIHLLLRRCLVKDHRRRLRDIGEARAEIEQAIADPAGTSLGWVGIPESTVSRRALSLGSGVLLALAGLLLGALVTWLGLGVARSRSLDRSTPPVQFEFALRAPGSSGASPLSPVRIALSPDGSAMVVEVAGANQPLYVRELDALDLRALDGTEGASNPFFSPDGQWVGYFDEEKILRVPRSGGQPLPICSNKTRFPGGLWFDDETLFFVEDDEKSIHRVNPHGGEPEEFLATKLVADIVGFDQLRRVPGRDYFLLSGYTGNSIVAYKIVAVSATDASVVEIVAQASDPTVVRDGYLLYLRDSSFYALPFDFDGMRPTGMEALALSDVTSDNWGSQGILDVSWNGTLAYTPGKRQVVGRHLAYVDRNGNVERVPDLTDAFNGPLRLSPDAHRVAVNTLRQRLELWSLHLASGQMQRLYSEGEGYSFAWSPSGNRLAFSLVRSKEGLYVPEVAIKDLASGSLNVLSLSGHGFSPNAWLPSGEELILTRSSLTGVQTDLVLYSLKSGEEPKPILDSPANEWEAELSHDGKWLAYLSDEAGRSEVFLQPFPPDGRRWQVSYQGAGDPLRWARDGSELYWVADDRMMAAKIRTEPEFAVEPPVELFTSPWPRAYNRWAGLDVAPDGRFLMIEPAEWEQQPRNVRVITNWATGLPR